MRKCGQVWEVAGTFVAPNNLIARTLPFPQTCPHLHPPTLNAYPCALQLILIHICPHPLRSPHTHCSPPR